MAKSRKRAAARPRRHPALTTLARLGHAARGLIYLLVGGYAMLAAFRSEQQPHGIADALHAIANTPFRLAVALVLGLGLACFAGYLAIVGLWEFAQQHDARHWLAATGMVGDAAIYVAVMVSVLGGALGWHGGERSTHTWTAWLFQQPFGRGLAGAAGIIVLGCGIGLMIWALAAHIGRDVALPRYEMKVVRPVGRYGVGGRGLAISLVGFYWFLAAVNADPGKAHQLGGALQELRQTSYGWGLLVVVGLAFVCSALFDLVDAFFHKPEPVRHGVAQIGGAGR